MLVPSCLLKRQSIHVDALFWRRNYFGVFQFVNVFFLHVGNQKHLVQSPVLVESRGPLFNSSQEPDWVEEAANPIRVQLATPLFEPLHVLSVPSVEVIGPGAQIRLAPRYVKPLFWHLCVVNCICRILELVCESALLNSCYCLPDKAK